MTRYRELVGLGGGSVVYEYTSSIPHDREIFREAVLVLSAHLLHLRERGLIPGEAACRLAEALREALARGPGLLEGGYEDVWEALEDWLQRRAGEAAGFLPLGRSRNDHVSAALRLYSLRMLAELLRWLVEARRALLEAAGRLEGVPVLFHTHSQPSQLATLDCLLLAWEESLASSFQLASAAAGLVDRSPLGASAGAGTLAPLEPGRLAWLLGFREAIVNPLYAAGSRFDVSAAAAAAALFLVEASRIAEDLMLYSSPYVGAARLPEEHVATSSVMPHKRNPATLEVLRARAARAVGLLAGLLSVQKGLPSGYSLDLQEANPLLYMVLRDAAEAAWLLADLLPRVEWSRERLEELAERYMAWGAELAEALALKTGRPFREAYAEAAAAIREGRAGELLKSLGYASPFELVAARSTGCRPGAGRAEALQRLERDAAEAERLYSRVVGSMQRLLEKLGEVAAECRG
ncbi:MAG: argininosuccinate lyase [Crenarchaeota archaeon]|nr:argininosuccinate lyase [Thermoproteota archaeon]